MSLVTKEKASDLQEAMAMYRARERITQEELARRCGLSLSTIRTAENGTITPNAKTYMQIKLVIDPPVE